MKKSGLMALAAGAASTSAGVREVGVDAKTGAILENIPEKGGD